MKKPEIIEKLRSLPFDKRDYWVVAGAAMALYGVREETNDIDLGCTHALAERLQAEGYSAAPAPDGTRRFKLPGDIEVFENWLCGTVAEAEGLPVVSLPGLVEMKRRLGRDKDLRDLRLIEEFLRSRRRKLPSPLRVLFFDIGYTLMNEDEAWLVRCREQAETPESKLLGLGAEDIYREIEAALNARLPQFRSVISKYGFTVAAPYRSELETLYPDAPGVLASLSERYELGVIANQSAGLEDRLEEKGIRGYFKYVVSSAEAGAAKPDPRIFEAALSLSACPPGEACMIGDRLDNDIIPAKAAGMKTAWVKQGFGRLQSPRGEAEAPDFTVENIAKLIEIL
ncbi:MAG: HAD family hydrolase [Clostridia bacterium]|nr:HAD family hydrolase [Clostridia bacterium]